MRCRQGESRRQSRAATPDGPLPRLAREITAVERRRATGRHWGDSAVRPFCCLLFGGCVCVRERVARWQSPQNPGHPPKQKRELQARQTYCALAADASSVWLTLVSCFLLYSSFLPTSNPTQRVDSPIQLAFSFFEKPPTSPHFVPKDYADNILGIVRSPASRL